MSIKDVMQRQSTAQGAGAKRRLSQLLKICGSTPAARFRTCTFILQFKTRDRSFGTRPSGDRASRCSVPEHISGWTAADLASSTLASGRTSERFVFPADRTAGVVRVRADFVGSDRV